MACVVSTWLTSYSVLTFFSHFTIMSFQDSGRTSLFHAAVRKYTDLLRKLLERGADVNIQDNVSTEFVIQLSISASKVWVVHAKM